MITIVDKEVIKVGGFPVNKDEENEKRGNLKRLILMVSALVEIREYGRALEELRRAEKAIEALCLYRDCGEGEVVLDNLKNWMWELPTSRN